MRQLTTGCLCLIVIGLVGADWLQFRGADTSSVAPDQNVPVSIGENIAWAAELPGRGLSGPIVIGNRVVLTASSGYLQDRLHVLCFDSVTGKKQWERQFWATGQTLCHPKMCNATPTPASDGERIFAFYSSNDLVCLDLEGNLQWYRGLNHDYPNASNSLGMSSSLLVAGGTLIAQVENHSDSFTAGIDVHTGANRWKIERPAADNWTSPTVLKGKTASDDLVVLQSSEGLLAVEPTRGAEVWRFAESCSIIPSTANADGVLFVPCRGLTALQVDPAGGPPQVLWQSNKLAPVTPTPLVYEGRLYNIGGGGVLTCADAKSGNSVWQTRLQVPVGEKTAKGDYSATPIAAGGHLYLFNEEGIGLVVKIGEKGGVVATHDFGETILATPAIANDALYVRSDKHLWKIAGK